MENIQTTDQKTDFKKERAHFPFTPSGKSIVKKFAQVYDEDLGIDIVKETEDFNIYEFIQASSSQTDIAMMKETMIRTGQIPNVDPTLQWGQDLTFMPSDIHELYKTVGDANKTFEALDDKVKAAFGNDSSVFLASLIDNTYSQKVSSYLNKLAKEMEVKPNE